MKQYTLVARTRNGEASGGCSTLDVVPATTWSVRTAGLDVVGVDPSAVMVDGNGARRTAVVRAAGERLPLRADSFSGCRMETVLMHVDDPAVVVAEALRCLEPGGLVTVFEPDWHSLVVKSDEMDERASWMSSVKHSDMGARLWTLLEHLGCDVLDRIEELSVWQSLTTLEQVADFPASVDRAVATGIDTPGTRDDGSTSNEAREAQTVTTLLPKIQVVAVKR